MAETQTFLYAVRMLVPHQDPQPIKVGFSTNPNNRMRHYDCGPYPCEWLGVWPGTIDDEREFHAKFRGIRLTGEWFAPSEEFLNAVKSNIRKYEESLVSPALIERRRRLHDRAMQSLADHVAGPDAA